MNESTREDIAHLGRRSTYTHQVGMGSDYTQEEIEFMEAIRHYMTTHKVRFPSFTEILAIAKSLGYRREVCTCAAVDTLK